MLLLGPRQTGKTTLLASLAADLRLALVEPRIRQRYEKDPSQLSAEVRALGRITEHDGAEEGFVVCQAPNHLALTEHVTALPWQSLARDGGPILDALT